MEGKLPEIYWYVFWIGLVIISFFMAWLGGRSAHKKSMAALDLLRLYAEKGAEPPPALVDNITRHALDVDDAGQGKPQGRAPLVKSFAGFLFMACAAWGIGAWLEASGGPQWGQIAAKAAMAFFGFGSFGFLVLALLTRDK